MEEWTQALRSKQWPLQSVLKSKTKKSEAPKDHNIYVYEPCVVCLHMNICVCMCVSAFLRIHKQMIHFHSLLELWVPTYEKNGRI